MTSRIISWFSCGAASAVAAKIAINTYGKDSVDIIYCEVVEEHPDNKRFLKDCEKWFGKKIKILGNDKYNRSIYEVFYKTKYLCGPGGARCTHELKKSIREKMQKFDDIHIFGYTSEEQSRFDRFLDANGQINVIAPLIEKHICKSDCYQMILNADIDIPVMYSLGYNNNNCRGCVKSSSPGYWLKIKQDFPEMFEKMNTVEKHLGRSVCKISMTTVKKKYPEIYDKLEDQNKLYWRPKLHELPSDIIAIDRSPKMECGIFCHATEDDYNE